LDAPAVAVTADGSFTLRGMELKKISAGGYTMQLIVYDNQRSDKYRIATQAIDFQVRD